MNRKIIGIVLLVGLAIIGFTLWNDNSVSRVTPDGSALKLSGAKVGRSNAYAHGTMPSKFLGNLIPSNGFTVAGLQVRRPDRVKVWGPEGVDVLSAELHLAPGSPRESILVSPPFYRKFRLLISGDDGFPFVKEFNGFKAQVDGLFASISAWSFPRDSRTLRFRLEERDNQNTRDWREFATFAIDNPKPAQIETWKPQTRPRLKLAENLEVEVGELTVRHEPIHPTDIWEHTAFLPVRVRSDGHVSTNWGILDGNVRDASGNQDAFASGKKITTNDWLVYRMFRPLDPAKVWRIHANFAREANFDATNLFSFTIAWPLHGILQTNLGGHPAAIQFVNTDMLSVELTNKPPGVRMTFVGATDDAGNNLDNWSGSWGQHSFWKSLKLSKPTTIHATIAIRENYEADVTLQPQLESAPAEKE